MQEPFQTGIEERAAWSILAHTERALAGIQVLRENAEKTRSKG